MNKEKQICENIKKIWYDMACRQYSVLFFSMKILCHEYRTHFSHHITNFGKTIYNEKNYNFAACFMLRHF